tara:strand:- start:75 stop:419 length:345 start_codon:yes stop_codon:yes gene_type:complete
MRAHVIEDNVVVNTIEVDSLDFADNLVEATSGGIGWSYSDGNFTAPTDTLTDEEKAAAERTRRDNLLAESDYTQMPDYSLSNKSAWATYRQALRDLPTHSNWPNLEDSDWPEKP